MINGGFPRRPFSSHGSPNSSYSQSLAMVHLYFPILGSMKTNAPAKIQGKYWVIDDCLITGRVPVEEITGPVRPPIGVVGVYGVKTGGSTFEKYGAFGNSSRIFLSWSSNKNA